MRCCNLGNSQGKVAIDHDNFTACDDSVSNHQIDGFRHVPIQLHHVHFFGQQNAEMQAWYAKTFGAKASTTPNGAPVDDVPGAQLRFNKADAAQAPTKGRVLDHIGFDVVDLQAFTKKLEAEGIKLDRPYTKLPNGIALAFITDPWGTYIELNERPNAAYIN